MIPYEKRLSPKSDNVVNNILIAYFSHTKAMDCTAKDSVPGVISVSYVLSWSWKRKFDRVITDLMRLRSAYGDG